MMSKQREKRYTPATKAYKNEEFLGSSVARNIRILCEYEESMMRLKQHKVKATVLIFGSARARDHEDYDLTHAELSEQLASTTNPKHRVAVEAKLERLQAGRWMCDYYDKVRELSRKITEWSMTADCKLCANRVFTGVTRYHAMDSRRKLRKDMPSYAIITDDDLETTQSVLICTGGGPGFMQAANQGAADVPGSKSIGMAITLPFEGGVNEYVPEELAFEYHYFFTRKFWMLYHCQAVVAAPGGVGTLDELFEVLTLKQTLKIQSDLPVVLFGTEYWNTIVNWEALVKYGVVNRSDYEQLFITDSVEEAYQYLVGRLADSPSTHDCAHASLLADPDAEAHH